MINSSVKKKRGMLQMDIKKYKLSDVEDYNSTYGKKGKLQSGFVKIDQMLNEKLLLDHPEMIDMDGIKGVEFDVARLEKDNQICRVRSFSKVLIGKIEKLIADGKLPIIVKVRYRSSKNGHAYLDFY